MSRKKNNKVKQYTAVDMFTPSSQDLANAAIMAAVTRSRTARSIWLKVYVFPMSILTGLILFPVSFSMLEWNFTFRDVLICTGLFTWFMQWALDGGSQKYEDT